MIDAVQNTRHGILRCPFGELGKALKDRGLTFGMIGENQQRIIFEKMNAESEALHTVSDQFEDLARGIGSPVEEIQANYDKLKNSLSNHPSLWG